MKKVLYLSNISAPYRTRFFNELAKKTELTVVYERTKSSNRDSDWEATGKFNFKTVFLNGIKIKKESSFSFKIFKYIFSSEFDEIVVGCYNSPLQMVSILVMKLCKKKYFINLDGEAFVDSGFKSKIKKFFLKGAKGYFVAGEKSAASLKKIFPKVNIYPYYFSSLSTKELNKNALNISERDNFVLVVGQYFDYKGLDIALEVAKVNPEIQFKFIGTGVRTELLKKDFETSKMKNVEIIPFLKKSELEEEYKKCKALLLPSRQECWGLVINEAASFGTPIVSTWGSGAAIEFLSDEFPQYLAKPCDVQDLSQKLREALNFANEKYSEYLIDKSSKYCIENMAKIHTDVLEQTNLVD